ncbi:CD44 antigen isoform X2 [Rhinatrema bivittatum]|uniref:CD44 antigen isoform X2 n=1 Tax=Rhinatrema bivittatum TaxID=194408 RepID=UPI00112EAF3A|nr:CD44 antigen isoform X2 [Rhinatrema bivittatum]
MARGSCALVLGLCLLQLARAQMGLNITCRYRGVFHVEKNNRYSLTREEGVEICHALNCSLANMEQMELAHDIGFETCRYGWIEDNIVVPRIHPNAICAANNTGVYILISNITDRYDVYCFNASETREKVCEKIILPPSLIFEPDETSDQTEQGPQPIDPFGSGTGTEATHQDGSTPSTPEAGTDSKQIHGFQPSDTVTESPDGHVHYEMDSTSEGPPTTESDMVHPDGLDHKDFGDTSTVTVSSGITTDEDTLTDEEEEEQRPGPPLMDHTTESTYTSYEDTTAEEDAAVVPPEHGAHPDETQNPTETDDSNVKGNNGKRSGGLSGSPETTDAPGAKRASRVPDWLIITVSLISLALILAVCIAVNSRRRCGHKKKLVINGNKGPVEDGRMEELNGEPSKSQEMVHLVHQEHTSDAKDPSDRLMSTEQARNQQQKDMKIGV